MGNKSGWLMPILTAGKDFMKGAGKKTVKTTVVAGTSAATVSYLSEKIWGEKTINPAGPGDIINLQFPLEQESSGGMFTEIRFHSWKKGTGFSVVSDPVFGNVNQQTSTTKTDYLGIIKLPMPLQLATGYQGNFTEGDNMLNLRGHQGSGVADKILGNVLGAAMELKQLANNTASLGNTADMANATIDNNNMGMLYKGGGLRGHDFSWRLSAKNREEQIAIQQIVHSLKWLSSPANPGHLGGAAETDFTTLAKSLEAKGNLDDNKKTIVSKERLDRFLGGRLAIPPTCTVRFLIDNQENTKLFKVKDSFITNLTANYTASSGWGAHDDGSPMEVQIGLTMKEVRTITRDDVEAGY